MKLFPEGIVVVALAVVAGCGTIRAARETQERLASRGTLAEAASRVAPVVDLKGCPMRALVEFALANRPSMQSAVLDVQDARLALKEIASDAPIASATPWNAAGLNGSFGYSESSPSAHFSDLGHTRRGKPSGSLSLDLLIWDFGRNAAQAKAQAERVVAAEQNCVQQGYQVFDDVAGAYFTLLQNEALLEVAYTNRAEYAEHLRQAELKLELGEAKELDVMKSRLDLAKSDQELVAASNDLVTAGANLMAAMGIDASTGNAETVLGVRIGGLDRVLRALPDSATGAEAAFDFACTNAPAMQVARARLRSASADVDYAVANLMPSVSASLSLNWTDPLWYWRWGVDAVQSLFTGFRKTTAVDRARVALESAAAAVAHEEQQLSKDLELAIAERDNAAEALRTAIVYVKQARENLETVKAQYEVGDVSRVDFTDAVSEYTKALGERIRAFYRGQMAEASLFRLLGLPPAYIEEQWITEDLK